MHIRNQIIVSKQVVERNQAMDLNVLPYSVNSKTLAYMPSPMLRSRVEMSTLEILSRVQLVCHDDVPFCK